MKIQLGHHSKEKIPVRLRLYWARNFMRMIRAKVLLFFGHKYDKSVIPKGSYCYTPDYEKNKNMENREPYSYYVIPCPYYKTLGKRWNGCKFIGVITDDFVFDDQCKMCSENWNDDETF